MDQCTDKRFERMLHAYELGILPESETAELEEHLWECDSCFAAVERFRDKAQVLRHSSKVKDAVDEMAKFNVAGGETVKRVQPEKSSARKWFTIVPVSVVALAALLVLVLRPWHIEFDDVAVAREGRLAVIGFDNMVDRTDSERLGEIVANLIIADLSESQYVRVVSSQRIATLTHIVKTETQDISSDERAGLIADKALAQWLLTGDIVQQAPNLVLTAQLSDATSGTVISSHRIDGEEGEDLFSLVDRLTVEVKNNLSLPIAALQEPDRPVKEVTTNSPQAYFYYLEGMNYRELSLYEDAVRSFDRAVELDSTFAMAYFQLSELKDAWLIDKAVRYIDRTGNLERLHIEARHALLMGQPQIEDSILHEITEQFPDNKNAWGKLGAREYNRRQYDKAIVYFNKALEIDPLYSAACNMLSWSHQYNGNPEQALAAVDSYLRLSSENPNIFDTRGDLLRARGDLDEAVIAYKNAVDVKRDFAGYVSLSKLAYLYIYQGEYDLAREALQDIVIHGERMGRSVARTDLALIQLRQGKLNDALEVLNNGIAADKMELATAGGHGDRSWKHFIRALIYMEREEWDNCFAEFDKAIEVHHMYYPQNRPLYRCSYVQALAEGGSAEKARELAEVLRKEYEADSLAGWYAHWFSVGTMQLAEGNHAGAAESLEKALSKYPDFEGEHVLARAYMGSGRYEDAIPILENQTSTIYRWGLVWGIWGVKDYYYLGIAYEKTNRPEEAIASLERFLELWQDADSMVIIDDARERLERLRSAS